MEGHSSGCTQWHSSIPILDGTSGAGLPFSSKASSAGRGGGGCGGTGICDHPLHVVYASTGIIGWPRIRLRIDGMDRFGRRCLVGYGHCFCRGLNRDCAKHTNHPSSTSGTSKLQLDRNIQWL